MDEQSFILYSGTFGKIRQVEYHAGSGYISGTNGPIKIRRTMENLLVYLLIHANGQMVSDEELMLNVWEAHSLSSSTQRLGRVINDLKTILTKAGVLEPVIYRIMGRGYMLDNKYVLTLYAK